MLAKFGYDHVSDPQRFGRVYDTLNFEASKQELDEAHQPRAGALIQQQKTKRGGCRYRQPPLLIGYPFSAGGRRCAPAARRGE